MKRYAFIMSRFSVSMHAAPNSRAKPAADETTQALKKGERSQEVLGPSGERSDEMRYPQYRNYAWSVKLR